MEKNLDDYGRWRNITIGFRVSEEENRLINQCVRLSGLSKQEYITRKLTNRDIIVQGNPKVYKALKNTIQEILAELRRLERYDEVQPELWAVIEQVAKTFNGMKGAADE